MDTKKQNGEEADKMEKRPMRLIAKLSIVCGTKDYATLRKDFGETDLVPMVGWRLEDPAWKDRPRPIKNVIINPEGRYYLLDVGKDKRSDKHKCDQLLQQYGEHGWGPREEMKKKRLEKIFPSIAKKEVREEQGP
jgi:hypothetical protein